MHENIVPTVGPEPLKDFCVRVFRRLGVKDEDARITADVLVSADLRGVDSHGVARLRRYVSGLQNGVMIACPEERVLSETPATGVVDAGAGLGQPTSHRAMTKAIQKALNVGAGFVTVRNSNHYGIAGYYAMMALEHDCMGISMTNASTSVVPTFGRNPMLGTNPIAFAAPAGDERPFVLDMATSTVPIGKAEVYNRLGKPMPSGWAVNEMGAPTTSAARFLAGLKEKAGGGLAPLGGVGESLGGHKGYGLALLVDILCGVLAGAAYADLVYPTAAGGKPLPSQIGHFFGAWRLDAFRPAEDFKAAMDDLQGRLRRTPKAEGETRIYLHGEKEFEMAEERSRKGIPLNPKVVADLRMIAQEFDEEFTI